MTDADCEDVWRQLLRIEKASAACVTATGEEGAKLDEQVLTELDAQRALLLAKLEDAPIGTLVNGLMNATRLS